MYITNTSDIRPKSKNSFQITSCHEVKLVLDLKNTKPISRSLLSCVDTFHFHSKLSHFTKEERCSQVSKNTFERETFPVKLYFMLPDLFFYIISYFSLVIYPSPALVCPFSPPPVLSYPPLQPEHYYIK